jgi:hypothetical protein
MSTTKRTSIEPGYRIQLPTDWAKSFGLHGQVTLERTAEGILVRPCPSTSWDAIFATKLPIAPPVEGPVDIEVTRDDLIF